MIISYGYLNVINIQMATKREDLSLLLEDEHQTEERKSREDTVHRGHCPVAQLQQTVGPTECKPHARDKIPPPPPKCLDCCAMSKHFGSLGKNTTHLHESRGDFLHISFTEYNYMHFS